MPRSYLKIALGAVTIFLALFVYSPIILMIVFSFNSADRMVPPFEGFSLRWYQEWLSSPEIVAALTRSLELAFATALLATALFAPAGLAYKRPFRGSELIFYLIILGLVVPGITYGFGALLFFRQLGVQISLLTGLPVHTVWALPWGMILVRASIDPNLILYEEAARTLGCSPLRVFRKITLPLITPAIMAGALFAFTLSIGELFRSVFVVSPDTLPLRIFAIVQIRATPELLALGSTMTIVSLSLLAIAGLFLRKAVKVEGTASKAAA
jgi:ABC-type spermidine/putrescine transport system permease subunit II